MAELTGAAKNKRRYLRIVLALAALNFGAYFFSLIFYPSTDPLLLAGFRGNIFSGLIGEVLFAVLAVWLTVDAEEMQRETREISNHVRHLEEEELKIVAKTQALIERVESWTSAKARFEEEQRRFDQFITMLKRDSMTDIRLLDRPSASFPEGLSYSLLRGGPDDEVRTVTYGRRTFYVVYVNGPALSSLDSEARQLLPEFEAGPLKVAELYFCEFVEGGWRIFQDPTLPFERFEPIVYALPALPFTANYLLPPNQTVGMEPVDGAYFTLAGQRSQPGDDTPATIRVELFRSGPTRYVVRINASPPKRIFIHENGTLEVDHLLGHFPGAARATFIAALTKMLRDAGASFPPVVA